MRLLDICLSGCGGAVEAELVIRRVQIDKGREAVCTGEARADGDPHGREQIAGRLKTVLRCLRAGEGKGHGALGTGFQGKDVAGHDVNEGGAGRGTGFGDCDAKRDR